MLHRRYLLDPPKPQPATFVHIPLASARLCAEEKCEAVFHAEQPNCPACGSKQAVNLAKVLEKAEVGS